LKTVFLEDPNTRDCDVCTLVPAESTDEFWAEGRRIGSQAAKHLGRCRRLEKIYVGSTEISDKDLEPLAELPHLKDLDLPYTSVSDAGLRILVRCVTLKELNVCGTHVSENGVNEIRARRPGLRVYWSTVASEAVRKAIVDLQRMGVHVGGGDWSNAPFYVGASKTRAFCTVEFRDRWDGDVGTANRLLRVVTGGQLGVSVRVDSPKRSRLEMLRDLPKVPWLAIHAPGLADDGLSVLQTIRSVEQLDLDNPGDSDRPLRFVARVPSLEILYIGGFSDGGIDELATLPKLTKLGICGPTFTEGALEHCAKLPHLTSLSVSCSRISDLAQARFFVAHPGIRRWRGD
jgi:Leucine-rich repeat (LRR) protein